MEAASELRDLEDEGEIVLLDAARRRGAADGVEDPAVLEAVIGEPLDPTILVEIDRDHPPVDFPLRQERDLLGALGYVVKYLTADGGHRRRRAEHDQHLLLGGAQRYLFQGTLGNHITMMVSLRDAAAAAGERACKRDHSEPDDQAGAAFPDPAQPGIPLAL